MYIYIYTGVCIYYNIYICIYIYINIYYIYYIKFNKIVLYSILFIHICACTYVWFSPTICHPYHMCADAKVMWNAPGNSKASIIDQGCFAQGMVVRYARVAEVSGRQSALQREHSNMGTTRANLREALAKKGNKVAIETPLTPIINNEWCPNPFGWHWNHIQ